MMMMMANADKFPLNDKAPHAFSTLKHDIARSVLNCINEDESFVIETDASDYAIAATLKKDLSHFFHTP